MGVEASPATIKGSDPLGNVYEINKNSMSGLVGR